MAASPVNPRIGHESPLSSRGQRIRILSRFRAEGSSKNSQKEERDRFLREDKRFKCRRRDESKGTDLDSPGRPAHRRSLRV